MDDAVLTRRKVLGAAIREARGELTQGGLAERLGIHQPAVSGWESGRVALALEKVMGIEMALGLDPGTLAVRGGYVSGLGVSAAETRSSSGAVSACACSRSVAS